MARRHSTAVLVTRAAFVASFAAVALACGNISLSSSPASGGAPAVAPPYNDYDAALDGGSAGTTGADANPHPPPGSLVGNPLCNFDYDNAHNCVPDDSSQCASADAGTADAGDDGEAPLSACHVVDPGGQPTQQCTAAGAGGDGAQCQTGTDCAPSFECIGSPGRCRRYCCRGDVSCAEPDGGSGSFCDVQRVTSGDLDASADGAARYRVPVCMPVSSCALLSDACGTGQTCAIVKGDGTTSCVAIGPALAGDSCEIEHCASGLTCLGSAGARTCYQLCRVADVPSTCPAMQTCTSSAQIFKDPTYGLCQ